MPVICLEGASAVGKTTTAGALRENHGAFVVPEVNQLFQRPADEPAEWYFERQVERWQIALARSRIHELVVLDGDPFQPLWYNWAYDFRDRQDLYFMESFYEPRIQNKTAGFPDLYFILAASEAELRKRKASDEARQRRGFETHLKMIEPQRRYFQSMQDFSPHRVVFLNAVSVADSVEIIMQHVSAFSPSDEGASEVLFRDLIDFLRRHSPR
jgi:deoxyadenosine/deoxycytidine kinase